MTQYAIDLDPKFGPLQHIDVAAEAAAVNPWTNRTLTTVNDAVVRLGVVEGEFHWHSRASRFREASCTGRARQDAPSS